MCLLVIRHGGEVAPVPSFLFLAPSHHSEILARTQSLPCIQESGHAMGHALEYMHQRNGRRRRRFVGFNFSQGAMPSVLILTATRSQVPF